MQLFLNSERKNERKKERMKVTKKNDNQNLTRCIQCNITQKTFYTSQQNLMKIHHFILLKESCKPFRLSFLLHVTKGILRKI